MHQTWSLMSEYLLISLHKADYSVIPYVFMISKQMYVCEGIYCCLQFLRVKQSYHLRI